MLKRRQLNHVLLSALLPCGWVRASDQGQVLHGFTENLPPLNYSGETGPAGFSVELLRMMASEAKLKLDIEVQPWVRAVRSAGESRDSLLFSLARLPEREAQYQWVGPISERRIVIYRLSKRTDLSFAGFGELGGSRLGAVRESAAGKQLLALGLKSDEDIEWAQDDASNLRKLLASRMEYLVMLDWAAAWNLRQLKLPFSALTQVHELDTRLSYWYGLHQNFDPATRQRLQAALDALKRDGRYAKLRQRYFED
ncbi:transporter substrate-binding domain-containing protein [Paucibacter sp. AS339]|uniref:substrate-binding periplasmic protein n=1 Tax=Paucibacter hankyongi TaxID=3133434 RepID=UPI00309C1871